MHLVQRFYRGVMLPAEIDRRAVTAVVPALRTQPGFMGYTTVDFGAGLFGTFTMHTDRAQSDEASAAVPGVIRSSLADLIPHLPVQRGGEVLQHHRSGGRATVMVVRHYDRCADAAELGRRVAEQILPRFSVLPGLQGYTLVDEGAGRVTSLNLFGTVEDSEVANALVAPLVRLHLDGLLPQPPETRVGTVLSDTQG